MPKAQELDYIAEQLRPLAIPIDELTPDPENARLHPKRNIDTVLRSLLEYGQRLPIIVQREGMIVRAGNARLEAAKQLGWTHIAALVMDDDEAMAKAFAIMDNKSADLAEWDFQQLANLMQELSSLDFDLEMTGFADFEFDTLMQGDWSATTNGAAEESTKFHEGAGRHMLTVNDQQWEIISGAFERYKETDQPEINLGEFLTMLAQRYQERQCGN